MTLRQTINSGLGSLEKLKVILKNYEVSRIMVVTGKKSFETSGAKIQIIEALRDFQVTFYSDFDPNPKLGDVIKGVELINNNATELLICIGGGSVIDMAKLIKACCLEPDKLDSIARGKIKIKDPNISMIAIPTTAGSGSESTHFAVVYINQDKYSVAHDCLFPDEVILDGQLTLSATRYQKACNVLDAISQSIESAWAVAATKESQELSYKALRLSMHSFQKYVNCNDSINAAQLMIEASNLAGQAINISKTTAAHAWSYGISMHHNIPHGHAVWFTLPKIFEVHSSNFSLQSNDYRGPKYLDETMKNLSDILEIPDNTSPTEFFKKLLDSIGVNADLKKDLALSLSQRKILSDAVNIERMANNPIALKNKQIKFIFDL